MSELVYQHVLETDTVTRSSVTDEPVTLTRLETPVCGLGVSLFLNGLNYDTTVFSPR